MQKRYKYMIQKMNKSVRKKTLRPTCYEFTHTLTHTNNLHLNLTLSSIMTLIKKHFNTHTSSFALCKSIQDSLKFTHVLIQVSTYNGGDVLC